MNQVEMAATAKAINRLVKNRLEGLEQGIAKRVRPTNTTVELPAPEIIVRNEVTTPNVHVAAPSVTVEAPVINVGSPVNHVNVPAAAVVVNVDMAPIAAALDRLHEALAAQCDLLTHLVQALAELKAPVVRMTLPEMRPAITLPEMQPVIEAPQVQRPRQLTIEHSDGTRATVTVN